MPCRQWLFSSPGLAGAMRSSPFHGSCLQRGTVPYLGKVRYGVLPVWPRSTARVPLCRSNNCLVKLETGQGAEITGPSDSQSDANALGLRRCALNRKLRLQHVTILRTRSSLSIRMWHEGPWQDPCPTFLRWNLLCIDEPALTAIIMLPLPSIPAVSPSCDCVSKSPADTGFCRRIRALLFFQD
ncbi:hypothetical protein VTK56DRAFT_2221 [Thermocarpiscus australiensis]